MAFSGVPFNTKRRFPKRNTVSVQPLLPPKGHAAVLFSVIRMRKRRVAHVSDDDDDEPRRLEDSDAEGDRRSKRKKKLRVDEEEEEEDGRRSRNSKKGGSGRKSRGGAGEQYEEEEEEEVEQQAEYQEDAKPIGDVIRVSGKGKKKKLHFSSFEYDGNVFELVSFRILPICDA